MKSLLYILSLIYRRLMLIREDLYARNYLNSYKSRLPVISIGNISAGGTGKTPLCIFLCNALKEKGYQPVVLSRGYKGNYHGVHLVLQDDSVALCGDEPLLMSKYSKVVLSRDRIAGAKYIEDNNLGNLIILDDGLQHIRLKRNIEIITLDVSNQNNIDDIIQNRIIPYGRLREDRSKAMLRADFIILSNRMPQSISKRADKNFLQTIPTHKVLLKSFFEIKGLFEHSTEQKYAGSNEIIAFCGIANPDGFFSTLESRGYNIIEKIAKPDHYIFSNNELMDIRKRFSQHALVCTEKDAMRFKKEIVENLYVLKGEVKVIPEDAFIVQIEKKLKTF